MNNSVVIEYLLLENFLSLYHSTGMRIIEFDKSTSTHPITLILGANGSGKSILMSELNPSPNESTKNRSGWKIIPDESGRKIIRFRVNDSLRYTCKIFYDASKKTVCYLERENLFTNEVEELNPNGNVRSYEELVFLHLGYSKDYVAIGYLSESIVNFIEKKPIDRNAYIASFLPAMEEWLENHANLTKKFNLIKRQVKMIDDDVGKIVLGDFEQEMQRLLTMLDEIEKQIEKRNNRIVQGETYLKVITEVDMVSLAHSRDAYYRRGQELQFKKIDTQNRLNRLNSYSSQGLQKLRQEIQDITTTIQKQTIELEFHDKETNSLQKQIEAIKGTISNHAGGSTARDLSLAIEAIDKEITQLFDVKSKFLGIHGEWIECVAELDEQTIAGVSFITKELQQHYLNVTELADNSEIREGIPSASDRINSKLLVEKDELDRITDEIEQLSKQIYALNNKIINPNILKLRRNDCTPDRCEIVKELMRVLAPSESIHFLEKNLSDLQTKKVEIQDRMNELVIKQNKLQQANRILVAMNDLLYRENKLLGELPQRLIDLFLVEDILRLIESLPHIVQDVETIKEGASIYRRLEKLVETKRKYETQKDAVLIQERVSNQYTGLIDAFNEADRKRIQAYRSLDENRSKLIQLQSIETDSKQIETDIGELNSHILRHNEDGESLKKYANCYYQRKKITDRIYTERSEKESLLRDRAKIQNEIETLNTKKISKESLERTRNELLKKLSHYQIFLDIWSPRSGFPAKVIKEFLDEIKIRTNRDMNELWGGSLYIEDFVVSNSEFSIIVNRSGSRIPDASECSLSERAMLAVAISLSIMEIGMERRYDVIRLDEVDGPLDSSRRTTFVDTILDRINRMGISDTYIISHNNEFDNVEANVILLPGYNNLARLDNKNVVFSI